MKKYFWKYLLIFFLIFPFSYSEEEISLNELKELKEKGLLSQEDFEIILAEKMGTLENYELYKLSINGTLANDRYKVLIKGKDMYFSIFDFF